MQRGKCMHKWYVASRLQIDPNPNANKRTSKEQLNRGLKLKSIEGHIWREKVSAGRILE
jgi:hypothetical protein